MADLKISGLPASTTPLAGTEVLPIVQGAPATTKQVSVANLTAGRAVSAASLALTTSPLPATSGGTGQSSAFTDKGVVYASSTSALTTGTGLIFDGASLGIGVTPSQRLTVGGAADAQMTLVSNTTTGSSEIYLGDSGSVFRGLISYAHTTDSLSIYTAAAKAVGIDSSQNVSLTAGNLVQGTAAKGVDFSANTPLAGKTSTLLNWYEEGTWTPTWNGGSITTVVFARYVRVGKLIHCELGVVLGSSSGSADSTISLPWTGISGGGGGSIGYYSGGTTPYLFLIPDSGIFKMRSAAYLGAYTQSDMAGTTLYCSFSYIAA